MHLKDQQFEIHALNPSLFTFVSESPLLECLCEWWNVRN